MSATAPAATVLIPTHNHGETLRYSVPTALRQSVQNIEVFIVGDGVPDVTRKIARELAAADSRIRFFDFPKGPGRGELHRHRVLQEARGEIVCYLFDDDLWLPDHIAVMQELLRAADFAFTMPIVVKPDGALNAWFVDLSRPTHKRLFTDTRSDTPSVQTSAAHTLTLYRRLPFGWRPAPHGHAPDKYMWAQMLSTSGCVAVSRSRPTSIIFPDPPRRNWSLERRLGELADWSAGLQDADWQRRFFTEVIAAMADDSVRHLELFWRLYALSLRFPFGRKLLKELGKRLVQWDKRSPEL